MKRISIMFVLCTCVVLAARAQAPTKHTIIKFDVPGAGTGTGQGTLGLGIVDDGSVDGYYIDSNGVYHGFLRSPSGGITKFDPSGSVGTFPGGMNSAHSIVGSYLDSNGVFHGFTRSPGGKIKTLNAPGAGKAQYQGHSPLTSTTRARSRVSTTTRMVRFLASWFHRRVSLRNSRLRGSVTMPDKAQEWLPSMVSPTRGRWLWTALIPTV